MNTLLQKSWKPCLSLLFGVAALLFWGITYPAHLSYHEQFQLFLLDADYWWERVAIPGGVADYVAEFLTQFYYYPWAGACILALLFVGMQLLVWKLAKRQGADDAYYPLSFLPSIALWQFMGDENAMLSFAIALLAALLAMHAYATVRGRVGRLCCALLMVPLLYWAAGAVYLAFLGWVLLREAAHGFRERDYLMALGVPVGILLLGVLCPLLAAKWVHYPLYQLVGFIGYYRFPAIIPWNEPLLILLLLLSSLLALLPALRAGRGWCSALLVAVLAVGGYCFVASGCDADKEEALAYDQLVRRQQWGELIRKAEKKMPESPFSVTCLNLALGKSGQLGERMFQFYQNGTEGLLPQFHRDFTSPLPTGEAFYHLGMVNTAQRFAFEAMEAIPNYRKSGRCVKRLAETNLINGQYEVAGKYLRMLQKTLFYRRWAEEAQSYLYNEEKINAHPEWGWLRQVRYTEDFLFSDRETDVMLGLLFQHNYKNRMAFEYMLAYVMQQRDLQKFMKYYPLGKYAGYDHIPRTYQEALVYVWAQSHQGFKGMPWSISPEVARGMSDFAQIYFQQKRQAQPLLKARYGGTYWYYLLYDKR